MLIEATPDMIRKTLEISKEITETTEQVFPPMAKGVIVREPYDCFSGCELESPDCKPGQGGYHGCNSKGLYIWVRKEGLGAVCWEFMTPEYKPETIERRPDFLSKWVPLGGLDFHYEKNPGYMKEPSQQECMYTGNRPCFMDSTFLQTEFIYPVFLEGGVKGVWAMLAEKYLRWMEERDGSE